MNPNFLALMASLVFGVVVFPWSATVRRLGSAEFFIVTGAAYIVAGVTQYLLVSEHNKLTMGTTGLAVLTAGLYVLSFLCLNYAFAHPRVNLPIASAITAAYPAWTALITLVVLGKRFTLVESIFILMTIVGVAGLGLFSKPAAP